MNSNHASVNEQAGIYAGDEGYDVNVKNHTDLKGCTHYLQLNKLKAQD